MSNCALADAESGALPTVQADRKTITNAVAATARSRSNFTPDQPDTRNEPGIAEKSLKAGRMVTIRLLLPNRRILRNAMTSVARKECNKGNAIMTHAAVLAAKNLAHRNRICPRLGEKRYRVAIGAIQPDGVRLMRKSHEGHLLGVSHDHVKIEHIHFVCCGKPRPGGNGSRAQCRHPIRKSDGIALQVPGRIIYSLQAMEIRIGFIMNRVSLQRRARRMQFRHGSIVLGTRRLVDRG